MITSAEEFYRLRNSGIKAEYDLATHEEASLSTWLEVIEKLPEMREWVVHNKTIPIEILKILSRDDDVRVRVSVATKRKLPEELQLLLAEDENAAVRERLVRNAKVTKQTLKVLAQDKEPPIREAAKLLLNQYVER